MAALLIVLAILLIKLVTIQCKLNAVLYPESWTGKFVNGCAKIKAKIGEKCCCKDNHEAGKGEVDLVEKEHNS
jgi:hypothetical protein